MARDLPVPRTGHSGCIGSVPPLEEPPYLVHEPLLHHPRRCAPRCVGPARPQARSRTMTKPCEGLPVGRGLPMPPRQRSAGQKRHLQGPRQALGPALHGQRRALRVQPPHPRRKAFDSLPRHPAAQGLPTGDVHGGLREDRLHERPQEEPGATHQDGHAPPFADLPDPPPHVPGEAPRAVPLVGVEEVETVVRHGRAGSRVHLRRAHVHPPIDLPGVHRDDLGLQSARHLQRQPGLARGRGADDGEEMGHRDYPTARSGAPARPRGGGRWWGDRGRRGGAARWRRADRTVAPSPPPRGAALP